MQGEGGEVQSWDVEESFRAELGRGARAYVTRFLRLAGEVYVALGGERDYLLVRGLYCSCPRFQRSLSRGSAFCHHLAGLEEAVKRGLVRDAGVDAATARRVVAEILAAGLSVELRRRIRD